MSGPDTAALRVRGMVKHFKRGVFGRKDPLAAVQAVDLTVERGSVTGLIGESGSGKTTLARAALGLVPFDSGEVNLLGTPLASLDRRGLRRFRKRVQLLFQNPDAHLNPGLPVGAILHESARLHRPQAEAAEIVSDALERVALSHRASALPYQLSGGEKRRVGIARLLIADPDLVVADEPTSGLDAALKAEILDLLLSRRSGERGYLIISHDLPLVAYACDRIAVMYAGRIVEELPRQAMSGPSNGVVHHPYTMELLAAAGMTDPPEPGPGGAVGRVHRGCPFLGACTRALPACSTVRPLFVEVAPGHRIACHAIADSSSEVQS